MHPSTVVARSPGNDREGEPGRHRETPSTGVMGRPAPPRSPIHRQPLLLLKLFRDPQPVLDQLRAEHGELLRWS